MLGVPGWLGVVAYYTSVVMHRQEPRYDTLSIAHLSGGKERGSDGGRISGRSPLLPPSPLNRGCGSPRRAKGVGFAVLLCLAAFLHQAVGDLLNARPPID